MQELTPVPEVVTVDRRQAGGWAVTRLDGEHAVLPRDQLALAGTGCLVAAYVYHGDGLYHVVYVEVDATGQVRSVLREPEGVLPALFAAPDGTPWVRVELTGSDRPRELTLPLRDRAGHVPGRPTRSLTGDLVGCIGDKVLWHDVDPFAPGKPDKLWFRSFSGGAPSRVSSVKLPLPGNNTLPAVTPAGTLSTVGRIHRGTWVQREFTVDGREVRRRELELGPFVIRAVPDDADGRAEFVGAARSQLHRLSVDDAGVVDRSVIASLPEGLSFFNVWPPCRLAPGTHLTRFTYDHGNGWVVVARGVVTEFFLSRERAYHDQLTGQEIAVPFAQPVLAEATATHDGGYCLAVTEPSTRRAGQRSPLVLVNRLPRA